MVIYNDFIDWKYLTIVGIVVFIIVRVLIQVAAYNMNIKKS